MNMRNMRGRARPSRGFVRTALSLASFLLTVAASLCYGREARACTTTAECASYGPCATCNSGDCSCPTAVGGGNASCSPYLCTPSYCTTENLGGSFSAADCPTSCTEDSECASGSYCVEDACQAQFANGHTCAQPSDCESNYCLKVGDSDESACCASTCGPCGNCYNGETSGVCSIELAGQYPTGSGGDGTNECSGYRCSGSSSECPTSCGSDSNCYPGYYCSNARCVIEVGNGTSCSGDDACTSGICVSGICCNATCTGACQSCSVNGSVGTCTVLEVGSAGSPSCSPFACDGTDSGCPTSCTSDSECISGDYCSSAGTCLPRESGGTCTTGDQCSSGFCVAGTCCNSSCTGACQTCSSGTCQAQTLGQPGTPSCAPYACDGNDGVCPTSCASDENCASTYYCSGGACVSQVTNGMTCTANDQCQSNNCAAGSCAGSTTNGNPCTLTDQCASGYCVGGTCCNAPCTGACNACGSGTCDPVNAGGQGAPTCSPFVCDGTDVTCPATCTSNGNCISGDYCNSSGQCVTQLSTGYSCSSAGQCLSNNCVGGVCTAVQGIGTSCSVGDQCESGNCVSGVCCSASCTGPCVSCMSGSCDPAGSTFAGVPSCTPYLCDGTDTTCPTSCSTDNNCVTTDYCSSGSCVPKLTTGATCTDSGQCASGNCIAGQCSSNQALGTPCTAADQCAAGFCVDGVCCNSSCNGQCSYCAGTSPGTCAPLTSSQPMGTRAACMGMGTACLGVCSGNPDACSYPAAGTACGTSASCTGDTLAESQACDGAGSCVAAQSKNCAPFACDTMTASCNTSCVSSSDCSTGATCSSNGQCTLGSAMCTTPTTVLGSDGTTTNCSPYRCLSGSCTSTCSTSGDCAQGAACTNGQCIGAEGGAPNGGASGHVDASVEGAAAATSENAGCGCVVGGRSGVPSGLAGVLGILVAGVRRRRTRKGSQARRPREDLAGGACSNPARP
jgi:MYXO-CTERM domain-containing protein